MCWRTLFLINCFGIEMVLCDLYLKRFDLTKGLKFKTFVISVWYKLCCGDHLVLELRSFSLLMNWWTESEYETWNEMHPWMFKKKIFMKRMRRRQDFLWNKMRRRQDLSNKMHRRPELLIKFSWVLCPVNAVKNYFTRISAQNLFLLFDQSINELI